MINCSCQWNKLWKNRWCDWDSNPGDKDVRCRSIYWATENKSPEWSIENIFWNVVKQQISFCFLLIQYFRLKKKDFWCQFHLQYWITKQQLNKSKIFLFKCDEQFEKYFKGFSEGAKRSWWLSGYYLASRSRAVRSKPTTWLSVRFKPFSWIPSKCKDWQFAKLGTG